MGIKTYFVDYPTHVFLVLGNEFCERFSFYGMRGILTLYLNWALLYSEDVSTTIYHGFNMAAYLTPLLGAMLADGWLGKYKTILYVSVLYAIGNVVMAVGAIPFNGSYIRALTFVALTLIALGTGGIKPCVSAFGADQFADHQVQQKQKFFSMFYVAINLGSFMSTIITPMVRSEVYCFDDPCYSLAFGIPAVLMLVAVAFFVSGTKWYTIIPPGENIIGKMFGCVGTALAGKIKCNGEKREHWLDYADKKYDQDFINDVKSVMRVLFMYIPLPVFWALFEQQGSRWTLQAGQMDGDFGVFVIPPDLIHMLNPLFVVTLVPLTETFLYPLLAKCNLLVTALPRLSVGMFLAGTAFVLTAFLQIGIDNSMPANVETGMVRLKLVNAAPCDVTFCLPNDAGNYSLPVEAATGHIDMGLGGDDNDMEFMVSFSSCKHNGSDLTVSRNLTLLGGDTVTVFTTWFQGTDTPYISMFLQENTTRTGRGRSSMWFVDALSYDIDIQLEATGGQESARDPTNVTSLARSPTMEELPHADFHLRYKEINSGGTDYEDLGVVQSKSGAVYTVFIQYQYDDLGNQMITYVQHTDITANSVNIFWQVPQYFAMALGEVLFSVTGLAFAYSQAPVTMKAVLQAAWLMTNAFGNLIVMLVAQFGQMPNQVAEFFLFAGLMYVTVVIFSIMAIFYTYVEQPAAQDNKSEADEKKVKDIANGVSYDNKGLGGDPDIVSGTQGQFSFKKPLSNAYDNPIMDPDDITSTAL